MTEIDFTSEKNVKPYRDGDVRKDPVGHDEIEAFCDAAVAMIQPYYDKHHRGRKFSLEIEHGRKRARIVDNVMGRRGAWCFVDYETGDILKCASWSSPAKHPRGNINTSTHGVEYVGVYGPAYLK